MKSTSRLKSFLSEAIRLYNEEPEFGLNWIGNELELLYKIEKAEWKFVRNRLRKNLNLRKCQLTLF